MVKPGHAKDGSSDNFKLPWLSNIFLMTQGAGSGIMVGSLERALKRFHLNVILSMPRCK